MIALLGSVAPAGASTALYPPTVSRAEWAAFTSRFLTADGRILDVEAGNVTHSEGQGYGMLLAVEAGDRAAFDSIWAFTRTNMQIRGDALISWRWLPGTFPHVTDPNNASDGDVLVAYALMVGGAVWNDPALLAEGDRIVADIERKLVAPIGPVLVLRPAAYGFDGTAERGVVNLSYYVYPAFRMFDAVRPGGPWRRLIADGELLTEAARFGAPGLTPDWIEIDGAEIRLPARLKKASSYDAVRIPLYMMLDGSAPRALAIYADAWGRYGGGAPVDYDLVQDRPRAAMRDPGYRAIAGLVGCAVDGRPLPASLRRFRPGTYFASTLQLLTLAAARRHHTGCVSAEF